MYNNIDNNNSILIDTKSSPNNRKRKINCVLCISKPELVCVNPEENRWKCPRCKNDYQLGFGGNNSRRGRIGKFTRRI